MVVAIRVAWQFVNMGQVPLWQFSFFVVVLLGTCYRSYAFHVHFKRILDTSYWFLSHLHETYRRDILMKLYAG